MKITIFTGSIYALAGRAAWLVLLLAGLLPVSTGLSNPAIRITGLPQSQCVPSGGLATFEVTANSGYLMFYQWRFDGANIPGANGTNLVISNVQPAHAGQYSVVITNVGGGAATSAVAMLTLALPRGFTNAQPVTLSDYGPASPFPSAIEVTNMPGVVSKVSVQLSGLWHPAPDDLDILFSTPSGANVMLMSDAGKGYPVNGVDVGFEDGASRSIPETGQVLPGTYVPTNYLPSDDFLLAGPTGPYATNLAALKGQDPNGTWGLYISDDTPENEGYLQNGWSLSLTACLPVLNVFTVTLSGAEEVPPNTSAGIGGGTVLVRANGSITYHIDYSALAGDLAQPDGAQICGPASPGATNSAVIPLINYPSGPGTGNLRGTNYLLNGRQLWDLRAGLYYVNLRSAAYGSGELRGQIVPLAPPILGAQPQDRTANAGENVVFAVTAASAAPMTYQWRFNRQPMASETNATLVLTNVQPGQAGTYDVVVSNAAGGVISSNATLRVLAPPSLSGPSFDGSGFHCRVNAAPGQTVVIEWSADMRQWVPVVTNYPGTNGRVEYDDPGAGGKSQRFYRAFVF